MTNTGATARIHATWAVTAPDATAAADPLPELGPNGAVILSTFLLVGSLASLVTWAGLWITYQRRGYLLEFAPRPAVPWGPVGLVLVVLFAGQAIAGLFSSGESVVAEDFLSTALAATAFYFVMGAVLVGFLRLAGASWRDLGLPRDGRQAIWDVGLGGIALLAAFPVYFVQAILVQFAGQSKHPLLIQLQEQPATELFLAALLMASVVAPLFEELLFRLLLQGWLEKVVDQTPSLSRFTREWGPILISSLLFALAHVSHGPDPVALFLLALILGYLYRRTHRLLPCIVLHSLFNASSLLALWLAIWSDAP